MSGPIPYELLEQGNVVVIDGYRGDNTARVIQVERVKGHLLVCKCLVRSTLKHPVFRSYMLEHIDGIRPVKDTED